MNTKSRKVFLQTAGIVSRLALPSHRQKQEINIHNNYNQAAKQKILSLQYLLSRNAYLTF